MHINPYIDSGRNESFLVSHEMVAEMPRDSKHKNARNRKFFTNRSARNRTKRKMQKASRQANR